MAASGVGKPAQVAVLLAAAALLAFHVIRTAAVADRQAHPAWAAILWPSHPAVVTDAALLSIASAAVRGQDVPAATRADVRTIAARAPLSPDPYLIEGAIAETQGQSAAAERLLLAARSRDPRSRATRYLLAERYLRSGRITAALIEMQALVSLGSRGLEAFLPALVGFARTPGSVPGLKAFFLKYPHVESAALSILAADPANADLVLALANVREPEPDWRGTLVSGLVSKGQYEKAYATWARLSGVRPSRGLFNPGFADLAAPPPFNWTFPETGEGVAEPGGGSLSVLYYGRAKAVLASQLLRLPTGRYQLAMTVGDASGEASAIHWVLRCAAADKVLADLPLKAGPAGAVFGVPAGCEAQWLELQGVAGDMPQTTELKIRDLRLAEVTDS